MEHVNYWTLSFRKTPSNKTFSSLDSKGRIESRRMSAAVQKLFPAALESWSMQLR